MIVASRVLARGVTAMCGGKLAKGVSTSARLQGGGGDVVRANRDQNTGKMKQGAKGGTEGRKKNGAQSLVAFSLEFVRRFGDTRPKPSNAVDGSLRRDGTVVDRPVYRPVQMAELSFNGTGTGP
jgi:hypothetical protein